MKNQAPNLVIKRVSVSPYFNSQFTQMESQALSQFGEMITNDDLADVLITNTHTNFDLFSDRECENLKLVIHPNSGYDNINLDFVRRIKAPVIIGNTIRAQAVVNYILSALFSHFSKLPKAPYWDTERVWERKLLSESKVLILGHGHVGKLLQLSLLPLTKQIAIYDPFEKKLELDNKNADVVIVACGLNAKSRQIIDKQFLNQISESALIINAARGECIKTLDLCHYLSANSKAFAVLDVFEKEPCDFSIFKGINNVHLTSHIAGVFTNIGTATIEFETQVIGDYLSMTDFDFQNKYQKMIIQNKIHPSLGIL